jgi:hypothetical protein
MFAAGNIRFKKIIVHVCHACSLSPHQNNNDMRKMGIIDTREQKRANPGPLRQVSCRRKREEGRGKKEERVLGEKLH